MKKRFMMFTLLATAFSGMVHADDAAIRQSLAKLGVQSTEIQPAPVAGMKTVLTNSGVLYVTEDGKHIIQGPMYDVSGASPVNVTNQLLMKHLNALEKEMIIYKAPQEKHVITVFTDITCGYCHKLHEEMKDYNALGITVRYLAFPRQGLDSQAEQDMKSIWCAKDKNKAFDDAMTGKGVKAATCDVDIANHYALGVQFGVSGTPAIVLSNGYVVPGYQGPKEMKEFLDAHAKQTTVKNSSLTNKKHFGGEGADETPELPADLPPLLRRLYASRGVRSAQELERSVKGMLPWQHLNGVEKAVEILYNAFREGTRIIVVGDFDADGATSTAQSILAMRA